MNVPASRYDAVPLVAQIEGNLYQCLDHLRAIVDAGTRTLEAALHASDAETSFARAKSGLLEVIRALSAERQRERVRTNDAAAYKRKTGRSPGQRERVHGPDGRISWRDRTTTNDELGAKINDAMVKNEEKLCHG